MHAEVFAVEDTAVQVCWRGGGVESVTAGDRSVTVSGTLGAAVVDGLPPDTVVEVSVSAGGVRRGVERVRTLAPPPGRRLSRFATINDLHIGARSFGTARCWWEDDRLDPHPLRCARAALAEALEWGASAIVVKGDTTQRGRPAEWERVGALLASAGVPVLIIEGNHETKRGAVDGSAILAAHGITLTTVQPRCLDLPGVRIVGLPTAKWHGDPGHLADEAVAAAARLTGSAPAGAVVALHHYPQRFRHPTLYPSGVPGDEAHRALAVLAQANPRTLVLAGHSHRHRAHRDHHLLCAETGSTKDFPGSWAGYTVHEGGVMQTTRRVMAPPALAWTERGRRVLGGVWGMWAPGLRSHRCFSYPWPA